ncbi:MAG: iron uptake porin [Jaaginema sp. PMC 1080.18]|nr:iron uptake porin [Jaaginema sp. PMC 1080.18]MEC4865934.1 iron uptake porin [Jaaginema sp. PMC 1078.18]
MQLRRYHQIIVLGTLVWADFGVSLPGVKAAEVEELLDPVMVTEDTGELNPTAQIPAASQFRDVLPSDWAYQALLELRDRYDCLAGYPDDTFKGDRPLTRYEFAAGLNACFEVITRLLNSPDAATVPQSDLEVLERLIRDFQTDFAILRGRVDGIEARTRELELTQFSTTTKLYGQVVAGVQGRSSETFLIGGFPQTDNGDNINLITNVQLSLITQFSPNSILLTGLSAADGNTQSQNAFRDGYVGLSYEGDNNNDVEISDLSYRHLINNRVAVIVGPVGIGAVNVFRGSNRVESAGFGPLSRFAQRNPIIATGGSGAGIGFDWQISPFASAQVFYNASNANDPDVGGIFGGTSNNTAAGAQLVVSPSRKFDIALQYINSYSPTGILGSGVGDYITAIPAPRAPMLTNALGASVEWRVAPQATLGGWVGYSNSDYKGAIGTITGGEVEIWNWMAYLNFPDLGGEGNLAGLYFGQPPKITGSRLPSIGGLVGLNIPGFNSLGNGSARVGQPDTAYHLEGFYRFQVSDNISLTPGAIAVFNPGHNSRNNTVFIGTVRATLSF